jgi:hypothetical protein
MTHLSVSACTAVSYFRERAEQAKVPLGNLEITGVIEGQPDPADVSCGVKSKKLAVSLWFRFARDSGQGQQRL